MEIGRECVNVWFNEFYDFVFDVIVFEYCVNDS